MAYIPSSSSDGQSDDFTVTATALDPGTNTVTAETQTPTIGALDTFLADADADGVEFDAEDYTVSAPVLSATKYSTLISENLDGTFNCATGTLDAAAGAFVPGACVEYTISVENDDQATSDATTLVVTDSLPEDVTFVTVYSYSGFASVTESNGTVTASMPSLAKGATAEAKIRVTID